MTKLIIAMAQTNSMVGDIDGNVDTILHHSKTLCERQSVDVIVFPELTLTGYPPEDLLLRPSLKRRIERALDRLQQAELPCNLVVGYPKHQGGYLYNTVGVIKNGALIYEYSKQCLPNYQVFDEKRYFKEGDESGYFEVAGVKVGLSICEDIWDGGPITRAKDCGADLLININASPFHANKQEEREELVAKRARAIDTPILYVNWVGGQDELVFDGGSFATDASGRLVGRAAFFDETTLVIEAEKTPQDWALKVLEGADPHHRSEREMVYQALVTGVRDYVNKNRFKRVVLGLSGGIDSALTLAVAVDALGKDRVEAVMMPFRYTSQMSRDDAAKEAQALGIQYRIIDIESIYDAFSGALQPAFTGTQPDTTEENIQARIRGVLLMAMSNKSGALVLTTGNKSEMAVGYSTLYGDMAGGFDVLKDVPKTLVFELAKYRNTLGEVIPPSVISRPPSAELAPDQKDEDSLPPYPVLDAILEHYIERDCSADEIVAQGFAKDDVYRVLRLVDINEYKRRQAPIGVRISPRAFGRDRRYPITNGWTIGD